MLFEKREVYADREGFMQCSGAHLGVMAGVDIVQVQNMI